MYQRNSLGKVSRGDTPPATPAGLYLSEFGNASNDASAYTRYWTQDFAAPR